MERFNITICDRYRQEVEIPIKFIITICDDERFAEKQNRKYLPYAFTEHGVTMLASVLKSPVARKMNIAIVRAFILMRKFVIEYKDIWEQLDGLKERISGHDAN